VSQHRQCPCYRCAFRIGDPRSSDQLELDVWLCEIIKHLAEWRHGSGSGGVIGRLIGQSLRGQPVRQRQQAGLEKWQARQSKRLDLVASISDGAFPQLPSRQIGARSVNRARLCHIKSGAPGLAPLNA